MVSFRSGLTAACVALSMLGSTFAVPLADSTYSFTVSDIIPIPSQRIHYHYTQCGPQLRSLSPDARDLLKRSTPAAPRFLAWNDAWLNPLPSTSQLSGYNVFALAFLLVSGPADEVQNFASLSTSQQQSLVSQYNSAGISLIATAFGSTDTPTSSGYDPVNTANQMASFVIQHGLNGIDVDYEDFTAFNSPSGSAESWLISFTQTLRNQLPQGQYIISHAPVAPWFSPGMWSGGGYLAINQQVGSLIDWYNVQFYNQGTSEYTTCYGLLTASSSQWPQSAVFQIAANGVDLNKIVIGKPGTTSDASNGYMDPTTLAGCVSQAHGSGWSGGVAVWQYPHADSNWITTVRGSTFPVGGSPPPTTTTTTAAPPPTTTTTTSPSPTTTSSSGTCAGIAAWSSSTTYVSGNQVTYNGYLWTANQWNYNEVPGGVNGAWNNSGAC